MSRMVWCVIRSCGHVFCSDCSDYSLPVPQQHLDKPVRVCFHCYSQASSDTPSTAAANLSDAINGGPKSVFGLGFAIWLRHDIRHIVSVVFWSCSCVWCHCFCRHRAWCRFAPWIADNIYNAAAGCAVDGCQRKHTRICITLSTDVMSGIHQPNYWTREHWYRYIIHVCVYVHVFVESADCKVVAASERMCLHVESCRPVCPLSTCWYAAAAVWWTVFTDHRHKLL